MQATGSNRLPSSQQSIRVTADGLSFYAGAEAIVVCGASTRVPMADFRREEAAMLLDYVCPAGDTARTVLYNVLPELEVVEIFGIDSQLLEQLRGKYPSHRILGVNAMVLETLWRHNRNMGDAVGRMYVYGHEGELLVATYDAAGLQWANTFAAADSTEAIFFILSAWRSLAMDSERDECLLIGAESLAGGLRPYLRHVSVLTPADVLGSRRTHSNAPFDILVI